MSFEDNPADDDPHARCAFEIHQLQQEVARLQQAYTQEYARHHWCLPGRIYRIICDLVAADHGFSIVSVNCPGCGSQGETPAAAIHNMREAATGWLESFLADDVPIGWATPDDYAAYQWQGWRTTMFAQLPDVIAANNPTPEPVPDA